mmetsp:Transcript_85355/g.275481  ORF Transcript_85355/g.275481 Transcript_85355/m.275481 type:complete len:796 (-) Transcript_85355:109-2496(-)
MGAKLWVPSCAALPSSAFLPAASGRGSGRGVAEGGGGATPSRVRRYALRSVAGANIAGHDSQAAVRSWGVLGLAGLLIQHQFTRLRRRRRWRRHCLACRELVLGLSGSHRGSATGASSASSALKRRALGDGELPVEEVVGAVVSAMNSPPYSAVLIAPPGAGKTTAVPIFLLRDALVAEAGKIIVTEPRRVAARGAARRMALHLGQEVGGTVGLRTRFDKRVDPLRTKVEVVTDGVLARQLQFDRALKGVGTIVLDEFHERSLSADLALTLSLYAQRFRALKGLAPLRILVMSATLDSALVERLEHLLGGPKVIRSEGRSYNVEIRHVAKRRLWQAEKQGEKGYVLTEAVVKATQEALNETEGDVLCFLPGEKEIYRAVKAIKAIAPTERDCVVAVAGSLKKKKKVKKGTGFGEPKQNEVVKPKFPPRPTDVLPLHGSLPPEEQDMAVREGPANRRRVILSTNVAEASITVPGVTAVIDSGLRRRSRFNRDKGMDVLETVAISKASAAQRAGRAGRLREGLCLRLWSDGETLNDADVPEISEVDLTDTVLQLIGCGVALDSIATLSWPTPPPDASVAYAVQTLKWIGAVDESGILTEHGRELAKLPLHPRLGHLALKAGEVPDEENVGNFGDVATLCAMLEENSDILKKSDGSRASPESASLHLRLRTLAEDRGLELPKDVEVDFRRVEQVRFVAQDLRVQLPSGIGSQPVRNPGALIALAYPDRVGRSDRTASGFVLREGTMCQVKDKTLVSEDFLAVARLWGKTPTYIELAAPLSSAVAGRIFLEKAISGSAS